MRMPTIREEGLDVMTYLVYYFSGAGRAQRRATAPFVPPPGRSTQLLVVVVVRYT